MNRGSAVIIVVVAVIVAAGILLVFTNPGNQAPPGQGGANQLPAVEVRSYQGEALSAISQVPENAISGTQQINESGYRLTVTGLTNRTTVSTYRDIHDNHQHYTKVVTLHCVEGWDATILWEGVLVSDLIRDASVDPKANTVIFHATDGYTTSFPLSYIMDNNIIMAYRMNNVTINAEHGYPFRLVAEDKWGYKWIKWINEIELSDNPAYQGYWEQRGYSNSGNLSENYGS